MLLDSLPNNRRNTSSSTKIYKRISRLFNKFKGKKRLLASLTFKELDTITAKEFITMHGRALMQYEVVKTSKDSDLDAELGNNSDNSSNDSLDSKWKP